MNQTVTKTALITGAAKRIGHAIALTLAKSGWDIVVHYHHSVQEAKELVKEVMALGKKAVAISADLAKPEEVKHLFLQAVAKMGCIDALINNASLFSFDEAIAILL